MASPRRIATLWQAVQFNPRHGAELLLCFIAKGILALPVSSDKAVLDMPWGSHVCQLYNRKEDLLEMLVQGNARATCIRLADFGQRN